MIQFAAAAALVLGLAFSGISHAQADTPEARRVAAQALVQSMDQLMGPERMMATMRGAMEAPLLQQIRTNTQLSISQQDRAVQVLLGEMTEGLGELMKEIMPGMYRAMAQVYVERFSLAEIEDVRRFYDSSAGRKSVTVLAEDMPRLMQPMMQSLQSQMPRLQRRIEAAQRQLRQEGIVLQGTPQRP